MESSEWTKEVGIGVERALEDRGKHINEWRWQETHKGERVG